MLSQAIPVTQKNGSTPKKSVSVRMVRLGENEAVKVRRERRRGGGQCAVRMGGKLGFEAEGRRVAGARLDWLG